MTNKNLTLIGALIDRSGSMSTIKEDTEGGYKSFIEEQKKSKAPNEEIECWLSEFDNEYNEVFKKTPIEDIPQYELVPRSTTALIDSLHRFVTEIGNDLSERPEEQRPDKIIILVLTDGNENSSREFTQEQLKTLIKQQEETYNWKFIFLGANLDAIAVGAGYGISPLRSITYDAGSAGVGSVFAAAATMSVQMRSATSVDEMNNVSFSEQERQDAVTKDDKNVKQ